MKRDTGPGRPARTLSSTLVRVFLAALVVAVLAPLGSVAVQAGPITCGFGDYYFDSGEGCEPTPPGDSARFQWDGYFFELTFLGRSGDFFVTVDDRPMEQGEFQDRLGEGLDESYLCIPMEEGGPCRDFWVTAPPRQAEDDSFHWLAYTLTIDWEWPSDDDYPGTGGRARLLHNKGSVDGDDFVADMCVDEGYTGCVYVPSPFIRSGDTDFQSFTPAVVTAAVAEPGSTLGLLGAGVLALWYRKRRSDAA